MKAITGNHGDRWLGFRNDAQMVRAVRLVSVEECDLCQAGPSIRRQRASSSGNERCSWKCDMRGCATPSGSRASAPGLPGRTRPAMSAHAGQRGDPAYRHRRLQTIPRHASLGAGHVARDLLGDLGVGRYAAGAQPAVCKRGSLDPAWLMAELHQCPKARIITLSTSHHSLQIRWYQQPLRHLSRGVLPRDGRRRQTCAQFLAKDYLQVHLVGERGQGACQRLRRDFDPGRRA